MWQRCRNFCPPRNFRRSKWKRLHLLNMRNIYQVTGGNFIIDDTMKHHTKLCKWIHGGASSLRPRLRNQPQGHLRRFPLLFRRSLYQISDKPQDFLSREERPYALATREANRTQKQERTGIGNASMGFGKRFSPNAPFLRTHGSAWDRL